MRTPRRPFRLPSWSLPLVLLMVAAVPLPAQNGAVTGRVRGEAPGTGVPFALVVLVPGEGGVVQRTVLTDGAGLYRFGDVLPGRYTLRVERIGFARQESPALQLDAGDTVRYDFDGVPRSVTIAPIVATAGCYTVDRLPQDSALAAVWNEAVKGVETRRAFNRQYAYTYDVRQSSVLWPHHGRPPARDSSLVRYLNLPEQAEAVSTARRRERRSRGYGSSTRHLLTLDLPDETEMLDPDFLRLHCLDTGLTQEAGAWELAFRPARPVRGRIELRGVIRLDTATLQVLSIGYEYLHNGKPFMRSNVHYGDVEFPAGTMRVPTQGDFQGTPIGPVGRTVARARGTLTFEDYRVAVPDPPGTASPDSASAPRGR